MLTDKIFICLSTFLGCLFLASCDTINVNSGDTAVFQWLSGVSRLEIHYEDTSLVLIVDQKVSSINDLGGRLNVERNGNTIKVTIINVKHSDEGDYKLYARSGGTKFDLVDTKTLNVEGLSSSDTGTIIGIVVAVVLVIVIVGIAFYCYKRKKRQGDTSEESATPMNQTSEGQRCINAEKKEKETKEEHHYDQYQPPSKLANNAVTPTVYSELGPGGRVGPKGPVKPSNYAEAKFQ